MGVNRSSGFHQVVATADELAAYVKKYGHQPGVYRSACDRCGTRIWHSGIGIGSHRRHCPGTPAEQTIRAARTDPRGECTCQFVVSADRQEAVIPEIDAYCPVHNETPAALPSPFEVFASGVALVHDDGVKIELDLSPAAEGPAWEWPAPVKGPTGYPFDGYDGSDESFEHVLQGELIERPATEAAEAYRSQPARYKCGDCGGEITPGHQVEQRFHLDDGSPQCVGRRDACKRLPGHFCCLECGQPPNEDHLKSCTDQSGTAGGKVAAPPATDPAPEERLVGFSSRFPGEDPENGQWRLDVIDYGTWQAATPTWA